MLKKSEIRQGIKNFLDNIHHLPKNRVEREFAIWYRSIWLGWSALMIYVLREGMLFLVLLFLMALWVVYEFYAKGR